MHGLHFLHRDIKPENILISKSGVVKVNFLDFENLKFGAPVSICCRFFEVAFLRALF